MFVRRCAAPRIAQQRVFDGAESTEIKEGSTLRSIDTFHTALGTVPFRGNLGRPVLLLNKWCPKLVSKSPNPPFIEP